MHTSGFLSCLAEKNGCGIYLYLTKNGKSSMELCASSAIPADAAAWLTGFEEWLLLFPIYVNSVYFSKMYS